MMLKFIISIIFTSLLSKSNFLLANESSSLSITSVPKFPIFPNTAFEITINPASNGKLINYPTDTLIIRITDENDNELDRSTFVYGKESFVFQQSFSKFLHINSFKKNIYQQFINLILSFPLETNNKFIGIYQISSSTKESYLNILQNLKLANLLYLTKIILVVPPKIELYLKPNKGKQNEFSPGELVTATCQSFGELPFWKPNFIDINNFTFVSRRYLEESNKLQMKFILKKEDHLKKVKCQTGNITKEIQIKIFHFPTNVNLTRRDDVSIKFNESIFCGPGNGYPVPKSFWKFVSGPINSSLFYKISKNNNQLTFTHKTLEETEWLFNCSASNTINSLNGVYNETIKFIIKSNYIFLFNIEKMNSKVALLEILLKNPFNKIFTKFKTIANVSYLENQKFKQTDNKLIKEILEIKTKLSQSINETKTNQNSEKIEKENIKSKIFYQANKIEDLKKSLVSNLTELTKLMFNYNKLQNDVVKQNDDISVLKIHFDTLNRKIPSTINTDFDQINQQIKNLTTDKEKILSQLDFVKHRLFWIAPYFWVVSNIAFVENDKREAMSYPFYSAIKGFKMMLHLTATKDSIEIKVIFPIFLRNYIHGWPFNCLITIMILNKKLESTTHSKTNPFQIDSHHRSTEPFIFDKNELRRDGLLVDDTIHIFCDVRELGKT